MNTIVQSLTIMHNYMMECEKMIPEDQFPPRLAPAVVPPHLLARAAQRRAQLEVQRAQENAVTVSLPAGSGHVIRVVDAHTCRPPTGSEIQPGWGVGTVWQCSCGKKATLSITLDSWVPFNSDGGWS